MSSIISVILNKGWSPIMVPGRVVRFFDEQDKALTTGPVRERILYCLKGSPMPLNVERIADAISDKVHRVDQTLRNLVAEGLVEAIGNKGVHQRFKIV